MRKGLCVLCAVVLCLSLMACRADAAATETYLPQKMYLKDSGIYSNYSYDSGSKTLKIRHEGPTLWFPLLSAEDLNSSDFLIAMLGYVDPQAPDPGDSPFCSGSYLEPQVFAASSLITAGTVRKIVREWEDPEDGIYRVQYVFSVSNGRLQQYTITDDEGSETVTFSYDSTGNLLTWKVPSFQETGHYTKGKLDSVVIRYGSTKEELFQAVRVDLIRNEKGNIIRTRESDADFQTGNPVHDSKGVDFFINANYSYDSSGRIVSVKPEQWAVTGIQYASNGMVAGTTQRYAAENLDSNYVATYQKL
ncbi:MAG: hypothetical protein IJ133_02680 [Clostridia bacterium]|nr:hypothetical protein [Clostridia bacterium]